MPLRGPASFNYHISLVSLILLNGFVELFIEIETFIEIEIYFGPFQLVQVQQFFSQDYLYLFFWQ